MKQRPIIVFDSGFGGISVLHRLVEVMPNETFLYFGDSANAPYGPRPQSQVEELTVSAVLALLPQDPKAVVIACNTATAAALPALQRALPHIPVIGIQPAVAQAAADGGHVLALATQGTLASASFQAQMAALERPEQVTTMAAPGIVTYVEGRMQDRSGVVLYLRELFRPLVDRPVDRVVLGCTHFPFAKDVIQEALGYPVTFYDASYQVACRTRDALIQAGLQAPQGTQGGVTFLNSAKQPELLDFAWFLFSGSALAAVS